jgi:hypothetical protein
MEGFMNVIVFLSCLPSGRFYWWVDICYLLYNLSGLRKYFFAFMNLYCSFAVIVVSFLLNISQIVCKLVSDKTWIVCFLLIWRCESSNFWFLCSNKLSESMWILLLLQEIVHLCCMLSDIPHVCSPNSCHIVFSSVQSWLSSDNLTITTYGNLVISSKGDRNKYKNHKLANRF